MPDAQTWIPRGIVVAGVTAMAVTWFVWNASRTPPSEEPVTRAEAEALLDRTVQLAQAGDFNRLCDDVADEPGTCRFLLQSAKDMHATPGDIAPTVVGESHVDKTLVLHLRVVTGEGTFYNADFAVARTGEVRSLTPVYWSGVKFEA